MDNPPLKVQDSSLHSWVLKCLRGPDEGGILRHAPWVCHDHASRQPCQGLCRDSVSPQATSHARGFAETVSPQCKGFFKDSVSPECQGFCRDSVSPHCKGFFKDLVSPNARGFAETQFPPNARGFAETQFTPNARCFAHTQFPPNARAVAETRFPPKLSRGRMWCRPELTGARIWSVTPVCQQREALGRFWDFNTLTCNRVPAGFLRDTACVLHPASPRWSQTWVLAVRTTPQRTLTSFVQ